MWRVYWSRRAFQSQLTKRRGGHAKEGPIHQVRVHIAKHNLEQAQKNSSHRSRGLVGGTQLQARIADVEFHSRVGHPNDLSYVG
ncbi:hypothetical protein D9M68_979270 [compost metagenome]